jgi:hypothetical protein
VRRHLAHAVRRNVEAAQQIYEQHGNLLPMLWVHGRPGLCAEPSTLDALKVPDWDRAQLLCAMRAESDATVIGRTDEVWVRIGDDLPPLTGSLKEHVETDPSISTGLIVVALDMKHEQAVGVITRQALLDDGTPVWPVAPIPDDLLDRHLTVLFLAATMTCDLPVTEYAADLEWTLGWNLG